MRKIDIRPLKKRLRDEIKAWRQSLSPQDKAIADQKIMQRLCATKEYRECSMLLVYVSMPSEVDTRALIAHALSQGKIVAAPRCVPGTRKMQFYRIQNLEEDLESQTFGVLEPIPQRCEQIQDFTGSICIVPALAYDMQGHRLGYGGGYYDRFLSGYPFPKIGLVYARHLRRRLWHGRYDVPVDLVVTNKRLFACTRPGSAKKDKGSSN